MLTIKLLIVVSLFFLLIKLYYTIRLESRNKSKVSILGYIIGDVFGGGIVFPILRKTENPVEKAVILKANIAVSVFWLLFFAALVLGIIA